MTLHYSLGRIAIVLLLGAAFGSPLLLADDVEENKTTELLASTLRDSLVTIRVGDRNGGETGMGTGFVIDESGLIVTNMHVIREGRSFSVDLWPNKQLEVLAVEATSRADDLALIRVAPGIHKLKAIPLAESKIVEQGAEVVAFGNPHGLRNSVVQGVVSAVRDIEAREMIQVAMPIEPGNSGGPLVDRQGQVRGIINMKSLQAENVGFAIPVGRLRELMTSLNPITIDRWVRLAGVDPIRWQPLFGAQWRERSGIIDVSGVGAGFGGRALCLYQSPVICQTFEISVQVKLDNEAGAAGLIFHADGQDQHYGFYPSNGGLRLTCFTGPTVYSWEIVQEVTSKHYLPGQWNYLKVHVEPELIRCFVNGELAIESKHNGLTSGKVGLAKFRDTQAEFRQFRLAERIEDDLLNPEGQDWFKRMPDLSAIAKTNDIESARMLAATSDAASRELLRQAQLFTRQADRLKRLAEDVRLEPKLEKLSRLLDSEEAGDLLTGTLLIAALDHPDMDIQAYMDRVDAMAAEITKQLPEAADEEQKLSALNRYLFEENGFHGSREEYYHQANNHMDRVIDDREGMPITLSILYMELGRRLNLKIEGVGLPGHFVARYRSNEDKTTMIDVFDKARRMTEDDVARILSESKLPIQTSSEISALPPLDVLTRILHNLLRSAERTSDLQSMRRYTEGLVALKKDEPEYRLMRGVARLQTGRFHAAAEDFDWLLSTRPEGIDIDRVVAIKQMVAREIDMLAN
jgi:regulator of sirC expression with transglutaminase-like and TPR domain